MKTHISEIKKEQKTDDQIGSRLLENSHNNEPASFSLNSQSDASQHEEQVRSTETRNLNISLTAMGRCIICDPDWCPDYKKRLCAGKA